MEKKKYIEELMAVFAERGKDNGAQTILWDAPQINKILAEIRDAEDDGSVTDFEKGEKYGRQMENERCQEVLAHVFDELGEQGVTLEQLQQAVFFSVNSK